MTAHPRHPQGHPTYPSHPPGHAPRQPQGPARRAAIGLVALLLAVTLAGCIDDNDTPGQSGNGGLPDDPVERAGTYAPWTLSDFWVFDMDVRDFDRFTDTKLVYYEESGPEFVVGTPTRDEALYHAVFSVNPILGRIHQELLSPHEAGSHAHMFPYHLDPIIEDGERWVSNFYAHAVTFEATYDADIETPHGPKPGFRITGTDTNDPDFQAEFSYVRDVKWFTYLRVRDADGPLIDLTLTDTGTGYSGPAHFIRARDYLHETVTSEDPLQTIREFTITTQHVADKRVESLALSLDIRLTSGLGASIRILDNDDQEIYSQEYDEDTSGETNIVEIWPDGGPSSAPIDQRPQWPTGNYKVEFNHQGEATAEIHIVGTQDNSGRV